MAAYGLPKENEEEKKYRSEKIQEALKIAIDAPMECANLSAKVIPLCKKIAEIGNTNIISDAGVAVLAARAAFTNQGQICLCGSRLFIEEEIYENFKNALIAKTELLKVGDPKDPSSNLGAVVSKEQQLLTL